MNGIRLGGADGETSSVFNGVTNQTHYLFILLRCDSHQCFYCDNRNRNTIVVFLGDFVVERINTIAEININKYIMNYNAANDINMH